MLRARWKETTETLDGLLYHGGWRIRVVAECRCYQGDSNDGFCREVTVLEVEELTLFKVADEPSCTCAEAVAYLENNHAEIEWEQ